jgi:hypothetical protein
VIVTGPGRLRDVNPDEPCDRCDHPSKFHAGPEHGSECRIVEGRYYRGETISRGMRAKKCLCDGFTVKPS